jgi:CDP-diacylglycerol--serine O-phosphatidyltransferase
VKKHLPNLLTLLNLACGTTSIVFTLEGHWKMAVFLVLAASLFDFLDGLAARLLNAFSETGKMLDSLADMVTFGVVPGLFVYTVFKRLLVNLAGDSVEIWPPMQWIILSSTLLIPVLSAIRLARFNAKNQDEARFFLGLPTPAHALFWTGFFWMFMRDGLLFGTPLNIFFLWAIMFVMAFHLVLPVPMLTLKFEHFKFRGNEMRVVVLLVVTLILLFTGIPGLTLAILSYILLSLLNLLLLRRVSK